MTPIKGFPVLNKKSKSNAEKLRAIEAELDSYIEKVNEEETRMQNGITTLDGTYTCGQLEHLEFVRNAAARQVIKKLFEVIREVIDGR